MNKSNCINGDMYLKLSNAYSSYYNNSIYSIPKLDGIINILYKNNFQLPQNLHKETIKTLLQAQEILNILNKNPSTINTNFTNNPFALIYTLADICDELNKNIFKSPYGILKLKSLKLITKTIKNILYYFINTKLEIFRFL
jgi:hypothetical protein